MSAPKLHEIERESVPVYEVRYAMTRADFMLATGETPEEFAESRLRGVVIDVLGEFPYAHRFEHRRTKSGLETSLFVPVANPTPCEMFKNWFRLARDDRWLLPTSDNSSAWDHDA